MQAYSTGRMYLNFPGHGEDGGLVERALGPQIYKRLQAVKRHYDPNNVFRLNQNISPG
jgi:FAD/FMN-containing dehydrogenase